MSSNIKTHIYELTLIFCAVSLVTYLHLPDVLDVLQAIWPHSISANEYVERMWLP